MTGFYMKCSSGLKWVNLTPCLKAGGAMVPPHFCIAKRKKGHKKRKSFKAETIERLSPSSKCYCLSHSRVARIQKFKSTFQCSMAPPYWDLFRRPCLLRNCFDSQITLLSTVKIFSVCHVTMQKLSFFRFWILMRNFCVIPVSGWEPSQVDI